MTWPRTQGDAQPTGKPAEHRPLALPSIMVITSPSSDPTRRRSEHPEHDSGRHGAACLSRVPRRLARTVLRGDRRSNAAVLPDRSVIVRQTVAGEQLSVTRIGNDPLTLAEESLHKHARNPETATRRSTSISGDQLGLLLADSGSEEAPAYFSADVREGNHLVHRLQGRQMRPKMRPGRASRDCHHPNLSTFALVRPAEAEGFEPPVGCPTLAFKASTFGRSVTLPCTSA
jgi:hypothetical protein